MRLLFPFMAKIEYAFQSVIKWIGRPILVFLDDFDCLTELESLVQVFEKLKETEKFIFTVKKQVEVLQSIKVIPLRYLSHKQVQSICPAFPDSNSSSWIRLIFNFSNGNPVLLSNANKYIKNLRSSFVLNEHRPLSTNFFYNALGVVFPFDEVSSNNPSFKNTILSVLPMVVCCGELTENSLYEIFLKQFVIFRNQTSEQPFSVELYESSRKFWQRVVVSWLDEFRNNSLIVSFREALVSQGNWNVKVNELLHLFLFWFKTHVLYLLLKDNLRLENMKDKFNSHALISLSAFFGSKFHSVHERADYVEDTQLYEPQIFSSHSSSPVQLRGQMSPVSNHIQNESQSLDIPIDPSLSKEEMLSDNFNEYLDEEELNLEDLIGFGDKLGKTFSTSNSPPNSNSSSFSSKNSQQQNPLQIVPSSSNVNNSQGVSLPLKTDPLHLDTTQSPKPVLRSADTQEELKLDDLVKPKPPPSRTVNGQKSPKQSEELLVLDDLLKRKAKNIEENVQQNLEENGLSHLESHIDSQTASAPSTSSIPNSDDEAYSSLPQTTVPQNQQSSDISNQSLSDLQASAQPQISFAKQEVLLNFPENPQIKGIHMDLKYKFDCLDVKPELEKLLMQRSVTPNEAEKLKYALSGNKLVKVNFGGIFFILSFVNSNKVQKYCFVFREPSTKALTKKIVQSKIIYKQLSLFSGQFLLKIFLCALSNYHSFFFAERIKENNVFLIWDTFHLSPVYVQEKLNELQQKKVNIMSKLQESKLFANVQAIPRNFIVGVLSDFDKNKFKILAANKSLLCVETKEQLHELDFKIGGKAAAALCVTEEQAFNEFKLKVEESNLEELIKECSGFFSKIFTFSDQSGSIGPNLFSIVENF